MQHTYVLIAHTFGVESGTLETTSKSEAAAFYRSYDNSSSSTRVWQDGKRLSYPAADRLLGRVNMDMNSITVCNMSVKMR